MFLRTSILKDTFNGAIFVVKLENVDLYRYCKSSVTSNFFWEQLFSKTNLYAVPQLLSFL